MNRISSNTSNMDMQYYMRMRESQLNDINNKIGSQSKIKDLRDDPLAAARASRFESEITRLERYSKNIQTVRGTNAIAEGYMKEANDILQRIRELTVQGANGTYSKDDLSYMGQEVDQLLEEMVMIANSKSPEGNSIFAGFKNTVEPFKTTLGHIENGTGQKIVGVDYVGNIGINKAEISKGALSDINFAGNQVFWAENQQVYSSIDATSYQVQKNTSIRIDGVDIQLKEGDNIYAIINKINNTDIAVKAKLDPVKNSLVLSTTSPHQLWLEDASGSKVLQDLGLVKQGDGKPPLNIAGSASVFGGSVFDMIIHLRDSLFKGDIIEVGGSALRGIDDALSNIRNSLAGLGAKDNRLELTANRLDYETPEVIDLSSKEIDLDMAQAITDLKMVEFAQKAALSATARIIQPTLLDYLR